MNWHWVIGLAVLGVVLALAWPLEREFSRCRAVHPRWGRCRLQPNHFPHKHTGVRGQRW